MDENVSQAAPKAEDSGRSYLLGHMLAFSLAAIFIGLYAMATFQLDFWQQYFFFDSYVFSGPCTVATQESATMDFPNEAFRTAAFKPIRVPHNGERVAPGAGTGHFLHARYRCEVPTKNIPVTDGVTYMHLGWVFGAHSRVLVDDEERAAFAKNDKVVIPLRTKDLARDPLVLTIDVTAPEAGLIGLVGNAPIAFTDGNQKNSKVFGLEVSLQQMRYLYNALPVISMSFFLIIGWMLGIRSRLVVTTLFYFLMVVMRNLVPYFADLWPWDIIKSYHLVKAFYAGVLLSFTAFAMEMLLVYARHVSKVLWVTIAIVAAEVILTLSLTNSAPFVTITDYVHNVFHIVVTVAIVAIAYRKLPELSLERRRVNLAFMGVMLLFVLSLLVDVVLDEYKFPVRLSLKMDVILPMFVGGLVLYTLMLIERSYRSEKSQREKMQHDLELARDIQDSLALPPLKSTFGDFTLSCYQLKHSQVAGDWMAVRTTEEGRLILIAADVTGKGVQAALVVHAIQSLWADDLGMQTFNPEAWIQKVNRTLVTLGEKRPHSATAGIVCIKDNKIDYYCMGHTPLFLVMSGRDDDGPRIHALAGKGGILGLKSEISVGHSSYEVPHGIDVDILLGTDGVFAKGSRTKPREINELVAVLKENAEQALQAMPADDDKTLMHLYRYSKGSLGRVG